MRAERVREAKLDKGLARHADAFSLLVDRLQQIDREIHVHALHFASGTACALPIDIGRHVDAGIGQLVELVSRHVLGTDFGGIALSLLRVRA